MTDTKAEQLRLGCPVWAHTPWVGNFFTSDAKRSDYLSQYGSVFRTVEGNSSFYGLPSSETVRRWCAEVAPGFEFCFKFPRVVSHDLLLNHAEKETLEFIKRVEPLGEHLGPFFLQLPSHFEPRHLENLLSFLKRLPRDRKFAVEVRNPRFFSGKIEEMEFNQALTDLNVDRVIFDTRALFAAKAEDEATEGAQRRKPQLPVSHVNTASRPFVRFVGHPNRELTVRYLQEWVEPVMRWLDQGWEPYFFTHMPDDLQAPHLGRQFMQLLMSAGLEIDIPKWPFELEPELPEQMDLFA